MKTNNYTNVDDITDYFKNKKVLSVQGLTQDSEEVTIIFEDGESFKMYHAHDCCESVSLEDINGPTYLAGSTFFELVEKSNMEGPTPPTEYEPESYTWTFYTLRTSKGYTDLRWYGESNGYYGEAAELSMTTKD